jgi:acyl carrier protein
MFGSRPEDLEDGMSFLEQGILDSTGVLELVGHLEDRYGVAVTDNELVPANLDSIDRLCAFLGRKGASIQ